MHSSPRRHVTRLVISTLVLMALGYVGLFYWLTHGVLLHEVDEGNTHLAAPLIEALQRPSPDRQALDRLIARYPIWRGDYVAVRDAAGHLIGERGVAAGLPQPLPAEALELIGTPQRRLAITPVRHQGHLQGFVIQAKNLDYFRHTLHHVSLGLLSIFPLSVLCALALAVWLANKTSRPVEEALVRERQFSRDASHELRTPLALILTNAQLILKRPDLDADLRQKLEQIEHRARRITSLLQDLLTLGRGDAGLGEAPMRFSLCEVLEGEVEAVEATAAERGLTLTVGEMPPEVLVKGSPHGIAQVIQNLLENALHYTQPGGSLHVALVTQGSRAQLSVHNSGPGIGPEDQGRVFERFVRLDHGRRSNPDGSGLGLAIARAVARAHQGSLDLASAPEQGTTFTLTLPLA